MAHLCSNFRSCYRLSSNFSQYFRNVSKLKSTILINYNQISMCSRSFSDQLFVKMLCPSPKINILCCRNLYWIGQNHLSRWTKYSKCGLFVNNNGRKKTKRANFAEEMRKKFPSNKLRETKRRVKRTIVEIKENVLTIPNGLCVLRIISSPFLAYLIMSEFYSASLGLFVFAGITDLVDGYIARNYPNQQSMIGSFLDPAADKLLVATLFIALTINGLIPVPLTSMILLRDVCLMSAGFYIRYVSLPPPKTLSRYFDMSFATARLQPTALSKANTLIQLSLAAATLAAPVFGYVDHFNLHVLWYITGTTTILSAASYIYYKKSTYKFFSSHSKNNK